MENILTGRKKSFPSFLKNSFLQSLGGTEKVGDQSWGGEERRVAGIAQGGMIQPEGYEESSHQGWGCPRTQVVQGGHPHISVAWCGVVRPKKGEEVIPTARKG